MQMEWKHENSLSTNLSANELTHNNIFFYDEQLKLKEQSVLFNKMCCVLS